MWAVMEVAGLHLPWRRRGAFVCLGFILKAMGNISCFWAKWEYDELYGLENKSSSHERCRFKVRKPHRVWWWCWWEVELGQWEWNRKEGHNSIETHQGGLEQSKRLLWAYIWNVEGMVVMLSELELKVEAWLRGRWCVMDENKKCL